MGTQWNENYLRVFSSMSVRMQIACMAGARKGEVSKWVRAKTRSVMGGRVKLPFLFPLAPPASRARPFPPFPFPLYRLLCRLGYECFKFSTCGFDC